MRILIKQKGDYAKASKFLQELRKIQVHHILEKCGQMGVNALSAATPVETGKTASSWSYTVNKTRSGYELVFSNSNINKGVPIAVILQYGHGTGTGGWVQGRDYINPALQPVFDEIAETTWLEVTKL